MMTLEQLRRQQMSTLYSSDQSNPVFSRLQGALLGKIGDTNNCIGDSIDLLIGDINYCLIGDTNYC